MNSISSSFLCLILILIGLNVKGQSNLKLANDAYSNGNFGEADRYLSNEILTHPSGVAFYNRGLTRLALDKYPAAVLDFDSSIAHAYKSWDSYNRRGYAYYHQLQYNAAIEDFIKVINGNSDSTEKLFAYRYLGLAYFKMNEANKGLEITQKGLLLFPKNKHLIYNRGLMYHQLKDFDQALVDFNLRLAQTPQFLEAIQWKVDALIQKEQFKLAEEELKNCISSNPQNINALTQLALVYQKTKQKQELKTQLESLSKLGLNQDYISLTLAKIKLDEGNFQDALIYLNRAIESDPINPLAYYQRSLVYSKLNDFHKALKDSEKALQLKKDRFDLYAQNIFCLIELKESKQAIDKALDVIRLFPNELQAQYLLGKTYYANENWVLAATTLEQSLNTYVGNQTYTMLAYIYGQKIQDPEKYALYFVKAQNENPNSKNLRSLEAFSLMNSGKYLEAIDAYKNVIDKTPNDPMILNNLAYCYDQSNSPKEALVLRQKLVKMDPNNAKYWYQLGVAENKANNIPGAIHALTKAISLKQDYYSAYLYRSHVYLLQEDYIDAFVDLQVCNGHMPEQKLEILSNISIAATRLNKQDEAMSYLKEWEQLEPNNAQIFYLKGNLFAKSEDFKKANNEYEKALLVDPNNIDVLMNQAIICINGENYQKAVEACSKIVNQNQANANVYYNLGVAYLKMDNTNKGCDAIKTAKKMGNANAEQWMIKCH